MAEYEALLLGLKHVKKLGAIRVSIIGDSELIIQQINGECSTKDPRLREYRGTVVEILNTFLQAQLAKIPRKQNLHAHSLAMFTSTCKLPFGPNHQFTAEIRHRPAILDNLMNWQVFVNNNQINNFLTLENEFSNSSIDEDTTINEFDQIDEQQTDISEETTIHMLHPTKFTEKDMQYLIQMEFDEIIEDETKIINLKDNNLPKGLTPLEDLFDSNDIPLKPKMEPLKADIEEYNLGMEGNPKMVKLSKSLLEDQKVKYVELLK